MESTKKKGDLMQDQETINRKPGVCIPWEEKRNEIGPIQGDEEVFKKVWEDVDSLAYMYIWQVLLSF